MAEHETLVLDGCVPTPLASYLKALGILRLLSSPANNASGDAADPHARSWWDNERFHLRTTLRRDDLIHFFLEDYAPTPIIAPWNGRAGFLEGEGQETSTRTGADLMRRFEASSSLRFANMRRTIEQVRANGEIVNLNSLRAKTRALKDELKRLKAGEEKDRKEQERKRAEKQEKLSKQLLLPVLRSTTESAHVPYVDACYILSTDKTPMPLLGSGGNDGSRDFGVNFAKELARLFNIDDGSCNDFGEGSLNGALFGGGLLRNRDTMGQFRPGQGGINATMGYEGENPLNPWDVVLAMEGTILFAGSLTRSWGASRNARAAFPFTFEPVGAGAGNFSSEEPNRPRGEIWTPIWKKPAAFLELAAIFSEGRLTLGGRTARTGLDAARSIAQIGLARGLESFERYSLIQPDSQVPYQATPLGRFKTPDRPRRDFIVDLEEGGWLTKAQNLAGNRKAVPGRARHAMRQLEDSLFRMTDSSRSPEGTRNALIAIGSFVDWLSTNRNAREGLSPPPRLSRGWIRQADDGTPEFRIAAALAGLGLPETVSSKRTAPMSENGTHDGPAEDISRSPAHPRLPMAGHFSPINEAGFFNGMALNQRRSWIPKSPNKPPTVVWGAGSLASNMIAVLERRTVEAAMHGLPDKPLASATFARTADVAAFLQDDFDDARCAALLAGLIWAAPTCLANRTRRDGGPPDREPPFAYAALKAIFSTDAALRRAGIIDAGTCVPLPPGLLSRLRAGGTRRSGREIDEAVRMALARARGSGFPSPFEAPGTYGNASRRIGVGTRPDRLAASLLIPISDITLKKTCERVWPVPTTNDDDSETEETTDAV